MMNVYDKEGYRNPYVAPINHNELNNTKTKDIMYSILDYCLSLSTLFANTDHIGRGCSPRNVIFSNGPKSISE
jgi:hypothetical protein